MLQTSQKFPFFQAEKESRYSGVRWDAENQVWIGQLLHNGELYCLGSFTEEEEAALMVNKQCKELGLAKLNPSLKVPKSFLAKLVLLTSLR